VTVLAGRVAVVTGASRGIGRVIADRFEAEGALVVGLARSFETRQTPTRMDLPCDVTVEEDVRAAVRRVLDDVGTPGILVNNAGAFLLKPLEDTTRAEFEEQLAVNTLGPFLVVREFLPHLPGDGRAHVVTVGSVVDHRPYAGNVAYGASKYGVRGLHEILAEEVRGKGVRATLVSPGPTDTKLWDALDPDRRDDLPARRDMLLPVDVAEAVLYAVTQPARVTVEWIRVMPSA
jgi:NAD(P)-dependent dehydrogenase (short-subunit alcohol dehydrogenase family)